MMELTRNCKICKRRKVPINEWWDRPYNACIECVKTKLKEVLRTSKAGPKTKE